jgi:hypothetical protein
MEPVPREPALTNPAGLPAPDPATLEPRPGPIDDPATSPRSRPSIRWTAVAVGLVVLAVVGLLGWNWYRSNQSDPAITAVAGSPGPVIAPADQLPGLVGSYGHSLYWAGPRPGTKYEITVGAPNFYLRYLPDSEPAGSTNAYTTVGTYEKAKAYEGLVASSKVPGAQSRKLKGGALVVQPAGKPTSAYFAFQGHNLLMEVYDPTPGEAFRLVTSGTIQPIS